uniref:Uncharacterized protein n=1 Tax=Anguilla anguilla TaxID=7936 RepID=A0A0E9W0Z2_ANGAN
MVFFLLTLIYTACCVSTASLSVVFVTCAHLLTCVCWQMSAYVLCFNC